MLFVIVFTNVRARGVYSFVLILIAAGIVWGARYIPGIGAAMNWAGLLRIHFNLAFYVAFSSALTPFGCSWSFSSTTSAGGGSPQGR